MTAQDAKKYTVDCCEIGRDFDVINEKTVEYYETVIEALEKQIPKKLIAKDTTAYDGSLIDVVFVCPVCNRMICTEPEDALTELLKAEYPHCHCGQALDWSDAE